MIPDHIYRLIVENVPILCCDLLLRRNDTGEFLLLKRANEPLKGEWWIIGGAVKRGETLLEDAARRIAREEIGVEPFNLNPIGYYTEHYGDTPHGSKHTLSIVFSAEIGHMDVPHLTLDEQSSEWKFSFELPSHFKRFCNLSGKVFI